MTETVREALRTAAARLAATSDTARLDAELLMAHVLGLSRSDMLLGDPMRAAPAGFAGLVDRRARHEPVAYILGEQEFYGRTFSVTPDVLIPRGDSEATVEAALQAAPDPKRILDCGTGSGALLLTLLAECEGARGIGIDASVAALAVAEGNADSLGLNPRATFLRCDWRDPDWASTLGTFDLVIANPPYVEAEAALDPDVRDYEPASALFAGADGLDDYRVLVPAMPALLEPGGAAVVEIGHEQAEPVAELAAASGFASSLVRDLGGRPRALILRMTAI